jgi:hypothetical protein
MTVYGALGGAGAASRDIQGEKRMIKVSLGEINLLVEEAKPIRPILDQELVNAIIDHHAAINTALLLENGNVVVTIVLKPAAIDRLGVIVDSEYE